MKMKELFSDPKRWTQGQSARTVDGAPTNYTWPDAYSFCFMGALGKYYPKRYHEIFGEALFRIKPSGFTSIIKWNDDPSRTIEDIQRLCNELDI